MNSRNVTRKTGIANDAHTRENIASASVTNLEELLEISNIGTHVIGADGTILRANKAELELLGYESDEYIGMNVADFHADKSVFKDILKRLSNGETVKRLPARLQAKDNTVRHVLISYSGQFRDGRFTNAHAFTVNVTDLVQAKAGLAERDLRLNQTYEHVNIGLCDADAKGRYLRVNPALCRITGYSREELLARTIFDVTHPDDVQSARDLYAREISGAHHRYEIEKRFLRKDGKTVWVKSHTAMVRSSDGRFLYSVRAVQDISRQKSAEMELQRSEQNVRAILESMPVAVYRTNAKGVITYSNDAYKELTQPASSALRGGLHKPLRLFWPDGKPIPPDQQAQSIALAEDRPVHDIEAILERPDGVRVPLLAFSTPLHNNERRIVGSVNVLIDLSERKEAESNQKILLSELSHRVKNNMQMMHSLLRAAARETQNDAVREALDDASSRLGAMGAAQQTLHDVGSTSFFHSKVFLESVSKSAGAAVGKDLNIEIVEAVDRKLSIDQAMPLSLIVNELITNVTKYALGGKDSGLVRIGLTQDGKMFRLYVEDEGPGFDFVESKKRSSGLGLVAGLAGQLGGRFYVERNGGARCVVEFEPYFAVDDEK